MVEVRFLHCAKCGLSFVPKHSRDIEWAVSQLRVHRQQCKGKKHQIIETSSSVTLKNGQHVVSRSWKEGP